MEEKTVVGIFKDTSSAEKALTDLQEAGISDADISYAYSTENKVVVEEGGNKAGEGAAEGAGTGAIIGGLAGLVLGIGLALTREAGTRYVRSEADLVELLRVPLLAVLPPRLPGGRSARQALSANVYLLSKK